MVNKNDVPETDELTEQTEEELFEDNDDIDDDDNIDEDELESEDDE